MLVEYNKESSYLSTIDIEDIGNCALECIGKDPKSGEIFYYYLVIKTLLGTTTIFTCGPLIPDIDLLPNGFTQHISKLNYNSDKISREVNTFINDFKKKIYDIKVITDLEAATNFINLEEYITKYNEDLY